MELSEVRRGQLSDVPADKPVCCGNPAWDDLALKFGCRLTVLRCSDEIVVSEVTEVAAF